MLALDIIMKKKSNVAKTAPNASCTYEDYISLSIGTRGVRGSLNGRASLLILEMKFLRRMSRRLSKRFVTLKTRMDSSHTFLDRLMCSA